MMSTSNVEKTNSAAIGKLSNIDVTSIANAYRNDY